MPNIDFSKFATLKYWLEGTTAGADSNIVPVEYGSFFFYSYVAIFTGFIILAIILSVSKLFLHNDHPNQPKFGFLATNFGWMGVLGVMWFSARQIGAAFLSARLWLLFGLIWFLVIVGMYVRYRMQYYGFELQFFKNKVAKEKQLAREKLEKEMNIAKN
jgi:hypothetical protein